MSWEGSKKLAFRKFPILDILAIVVLGVISAGGSIYDEAVAFGLPAFLCVLGSVLLFAGLRKGKRTQFLYGVRIIIIGVLAVILVAILKQVAF
ncbi:MAG: hypothetical protein NWF10_00795 [Candidatus Bathyarchaeota archaeon]|nr:hypothetical protein [Candidatus Bathyarchaeota archaeon]